jgi:hypothetical protein
MWIFYWIFEALIFFVGYTVARLILPFISFGKIYVAPPTTPPNRFNVLGYRYDDSGRIEISETIAGLVGFVLCLTAFF